MVRAFVALEYPTEIKDELATVQERLKPLGDLKLVERENLHMTLKFLGEVSEDKIEGVVEVLEFLSQENAFNATLKGLGAFPKAKHPRVIWIGLEDNNRVMELHQKIEDSLQDLGLKKETRFHPHYTLARVRSIQDTPGLAKLLDENRETIYSTYTVSDITLMRSKLTPNGPEYTPIKKFNLNKHLID